MTATLFFGQPWSVPALEGALQVKTPVGATCLYCSHEIQDGERAYLRAAIQLTDRSVKLEPTHRGCDFAMTSGHSIDICPCTGYHDFWDRNVAIEASGLWDYADRLASAPLN
jgi:hypothetical protein